MTTQNTNVPALRFPEFISDWKEKRFSEIVTNKSDKYNSESEQISYKCIELEHLATETGNLLGYIDSVNAGSIKNKFEKGNVLFGKLRPYLKKYLQAPFDGVCSSEIWVLKGKSISNEFLYRIVQTDSFIELANQSTGSKMPRADWSVISTSNINIPELPEQQKIASFLTAVDEKIQQLAKKKDLLEQYKKGVMQKIFSQEIRFKEGNGNDFANWEEKKLCDLDIYISDGNYGELYPKSSEMKLSGVPFIRANNIKDLKLTWNDMRFIDDDLHSTLKSGHLKTNDILVTTRGDIGMLAYVTEEFNGANINAQICLLRVNENTNSKYLLQFLASKSGKAQFKKLQTGSALKQLPKKNLDCIIIPIPKIEEQNKIANFLSAIDAKINLVNQQLEKSKEYKKGLLQQMFV